MNALLKGDYELYKDFEIGTVQPLFAVDREITQSPLLRLRILQLLKDVMNSAKAIEEKHISVGSIVSYFDVCGSPEVATETALRWLLEAQLIEPFDVNVRDLSSEQQLALTESGSVHLQLASGNIVFFEQMAITTGITNADIAERIRDVYKSKGDRFDALAVVRNLFHEYLLAEDQALLTIPVDRKGYECQVELQNLMAASFRKPEDDAKTVVDVFNAQHHTSGPVYSEVLVVVDFFNLKKGFGMVDIDDGEKRVFIHHSVISAGDLDGSIADGDKLLCDISRDHKGLHVSRIHAHEIDTTDVEIHDCTIVRVFAERGYGFVSLSTLDADAFFHFSLFDDDQKSLLVDGCVFKAEIMPDHSRKQGGYQVRKVFN